MKLEFSSGLMFSVRSREYNYGGLYVTYPMKLPAIIRTRIRLSSEYDYHFVSFGVATENPKEDFGIAQPAHSIFDVKYEFLDQWDAEKYGIPQEDRRALVVEMPIDTGYMMRTKKVLSNIPTWRLDLEIWFLSTLQIIKTPFGVFAVDFVGSTQFTEIPSYVYPYWSIGFRSEIKKVDTLEIDTFEVAKVSPVVGSADNLEWIEVSEVPLRIITTKDEVILLVPIIHVVGSDTSSTFGSGRTVNIKALDAFVQKIISLFTLSDLAAAYQSEYMPTINVFTDELFTGVYVTFTRVIIDSFKPQFYPPMLALKPDISDVLVFQLTVPVSYTEVVGRAVTSINGNTLGVNSLDAVQLTITAPVPVAVSVARSFAYAPYSGTVYSYTSDRFVIPIVSLHIFKIDQASTQSPEPHTLVKYLSDTMTILIPSISIITASRAFTLADGRVALEKIPSDSFIYGIPVSTYVTYSDYPTEQIDSEEAESMLPQDSLSPNISVPTQAVASDSSVAKKYLELPVEVELRIGYRTSEYRPYPVSAQGEPLYHWSAKSTESADSIVTIRDGHHSSAKSTSSVDSIVTVKNFYHYSKVVI